MGEVVNLRMARKRKARAEMDKAAQENRQAHGRTKAERDAARMLREREAAALEGHRREREDDEG